MRVLLAPLLVLAACPSSTPAADAGPADANLACNVGDPGAPLELQIILRQVDGSYTLATDGGPAPIQTPPQFGKVLYAGVLARNFGSCTLQLTTSLRDICTGRVIGVESRPVIMRPRGDGWAEPADPVQISSYGNLPVCPSAALTRDLHDQPYRLTADVTDATSRTASASLTIVPVCAEPENQADCRCSCSLGYTSGAPCVDGIDAGVTACASDAGP
jgi:hypothetical protein